MSAALAQRQASAVAPCEPDLLWTFASVAHARKDPALGFAPPTGTEVHRIPAALSGDECEQILDWSATAALARGLVRDGYLNERDCNVAWLAPDGQMRWLYQRVESVFARVNAAFGFALDGIAENLQFVRYDVGGHFDWHTDTIRVGARVRKLSMTIQLSDPSDYRGGGLEFFAHGELVLARARGTAVVFPGFNAHRVTPVTEGRRCALVAWTVGPMFR